MTRPTNLSKYEEAEAWMLTTFGQPIKDYLVDRREDPVGVAIVEVDQVMKVSHAPRLLLEWRGEDANSAAGRLPKITVTSALSLILLQIRLSRPTLISEMAATLLSLSPRQRAVLGISHDGEDLRVYERIWSAIQRLIALVDEFPGRRDRILSQEQFVAEMNRRDPIVCQTRRKRMFTLANELIEGSRKLLPDELRERSDGNVAIDATFTPLGGKAGNPAAKNQTGNRWSINYDGGFYRRDGSHGAVTYDDAKVLNKNNTGGKVFGTKRSKSMWGVEIEIGRMTKNYLEATESFPLLTVALSFHIPGEIIGEGFRMVESLKERGHKLNFVIVDRAYSNGKYPEYAVPVRLAGGKHVFDYKDDDLGLQAHDARGFIQVSGSLFLDTLPKILIDADRVFLAAKMTHKKIRPRTKESELAFKQASDLYTRQLAQRAKSMLTAKGRMSSDWTRRYLIPTDSPDYAKWAAKPGAHQGKTVMMKRPTSNEADKANPGGLKHEQHFHYGTAAWKAAYGMRNGVESVNRNLKRSQFENIADPDQRAVRGNTFTYLVVALATVVENMRQILSFYKRQLAVNTLTAKNHRIPDTFWQSEHIESSAELLQPPG